jgi:ABC-type Fe3+ transport system permease subunit
MILLLLLLIIIPIFAYKWAKSNHPEYNFIILGVSFGTIVAPFSMGLYATFFIPFIGLPTGMLGLAMVMFHSAPGYQFAIELYLIPSGVVTTTSSNVIIALINGLIWGLIYGAIGYLIDRYRQYRKNPNKSLNQIGKKDAPPG